ncbi:glycerol-3-phosphate dehydrogenase/oxidase [Oceanicoccus sp. KOV_DT_Chl]|uniref:glycerol-3-phosphate dehydrogenase/oxidase n=1 Tax=Oceanicoccus sp. KOV_DT_Chl TaxID=1904639 RepID=UPI000C7D3B48|nr:FAD-dependent oxidoreductase [Oceanicoccus sp. KOV_DT_Chl]
MTDNQYEVVVIGGGIHGAGVAQAAAAAGYKTLIIEHQYWAAGTSSRSSKLLHGGLRYLETAQLGLVRESLQERNRLLRLAPSLAHPLRFHIPVYSTTTRRPWQLFFGLTLYAILSGFTSMSRFSWSTPPPPGLKKKGLKSLFSYSDGQTNDTQLTQAVVDSAQALGAQTCCPATVTGIEKYSDGYQLMIKEGEVLNQIQSSFVVNCSGPWVNQVLTSVTPSTEQLACELVKGSHLILRERISTDAFYLESPQDQRAIFLLPWGEHSLLGTTEQNFNGDPKTVAVSEQEREYLLTTVRYYFPDNSFTVIDEFAGIRVLPIGRSPAFSRPRECILHTDSHHPCLLSLYGGKLTTYRHTAEKVITIIKAQLGKRTAVADTKSLHLV